MDSEKRVVGFTALFEILMILKRELSKEKNDEMKYSHFLCTLERANQEKLKMAIVQLKCVPCLNKFTTNITMIQQQQNTTTSTYETTNSQLSLKSSSSSSSSVSHANMSRLLKQMSLIVSTELQQIAIDLYEKLDDDKPIKFIKLKDEFRSPTMTLPVSHSTPQLFKPTNSRPASPPQQQQQQQQQQNTASTTQQQPALVTKQQQQINTIMQMSSLTASFKKVDLTNKPKPAIFNPKKDLEQFLVKDQKIPVDLPPHFRSTNFIYSTDNF